MWPTCLTRRKQPSSSKRLLPPSTSSHTSEITANSADPIVIGGDSVSICPPQEGRNEGPHQRKWTRRRVCRLYRAAEDCTGPGCCRSAGAVRGERRHPQDLRRVGGTRLRCGRAGPVLAAGAGRRPECYLGGRLATRPSSLRGV